MMSRAANHVQIILDFFILNAIYIFKNRGSTSFVGVYHIGHFSPVNGSFFSMFN
jgi:hypothetical protein